MKAAALCATACCNSIGRHNEGCPARLAGRPVCLRTASEPRHVDGASCGRRKLIRGVHLRHYFRGKQLTRPTSPATFRCFGGDFLRCTHPKRSFCLDRRQRSCTFAEASLVDPSRGSARSCHSTKKRYVSTPDDTMIMSAGSTLRRLRCARIPAIYQACHTHFWLVCAICLCCPLAHQRLSILRSGAERQVARQ